MTSTAEACPTAPARRVLMMSAVSPFPASAGNELHINRMLRWLKDEGYDVILVLCPFRSIEEAHRQTIERLVWRLHVVERKYVWRGRPAEVRRRVVSACHRVVLAFERHDMNAPLTLRRGRREFQEDIHCPPELVEAVELAGRQYRPMAAIAQYVYLTRCFGVLDPSIIRVVDTHDMMSTRREKVGAFGIPDGFFFLTAQEEADLLRRADVIMTAQEDEARAMRLLAPGRPAFTVAIDMELPGTPADPASAAAGEEPEQLLIVASDNQPNVFGVQAFCERAWPTIHAWHPGASLRIVGNVSRHFKDLGTGVTLSGFIPDLAEVYRQAQVVINPVYAGSGLKIKSLEAMAFGKPLVSWPIGVEGMDPTEDLPFLVATHWHQFAERVSELMRSPALREDLSRRALAYIPARYSREVLYGPLRQILERGAPQ